MDKEQMMAKHARAMARLARGERTVEDVLGADDFCLMRVGTNTYACFDCELIVFNRPGEFPQRPVSDQVQLIELTDDHLQKVHAVLQHSGKWDCVHVLDGTMEELQREVNDYAAMEKLHPLLTPEDRREWIEISEAAFAARTPEKLRQFGIARAKDSDSEQG